MKQGFRTALRSNAKPLIGFYSESGGGKTLSALYLAKGFCGDMSKVGMIETEAGRGEAFADDPVVGGYFVRPITGNFSPSEYGQAITEAEEAGIKVLIVDSCSHEWEAVGGVLDMAAENEAKGWKGQIVWTRPKMEHAKHFMLRLMQTPIPLVILCMRAKYPMIEYVDDKGKKQMRRSVVPAPKQSEDILYEMFVHGWFDSENHAFHATKYTRETLKEVFINGAPITIETGQRLSAWASGTKTAAPQVTVSPTITGNPGSPADAAAYITDDEVLMLDARCSENGINVASLRKAAGVERLAMIKTGDLARAHKWIDTAIAKRKDAP